MKTHYKKINNYWCVFEDRSETIPILNVPGSLRAAIIEWKRWEHLQSLIASKPSILRS